MRLFGRPEKSILTVCAANVCRSPMAEGIFREELRRLGLHRKIRVDSAGTHATQAGRRADPRALRVCADQGINLSGCRARQVKEEDFGRFDYLLAMDRRNEQWLLEHSPEPYRGRISLLASWAPGAGPEEIPDPYYGNQAGFDQVLSMLNAAVQGFLLQLRE
ncbi:MAG: low molecular weight phosphotyrosine protein phosphatase [Pseudomonadales bacterium]|nr:low molecular weight phosphotyrosine protein phosphatase [Halioglobus sp.]MCP5129892.1 low molecular weight phosphotyrosine protein phosphatase [Pseudomonadales bacterium]